MEVHKVVPPPHRSTLKKLKARLKETFFPDDPLRQFKGQPLKQKFILGAQYIFPILEWGPNYSFKLLKSDIVSGLTIASLAIPQGINYAKLANLPPIVGLYSSFVPPLVYAVLGSSRDLAVGPVSIASLVLGSMLRQEVSPANDTVLFLQLAFSSTFFAGLFQASLGILRLGIIIDFLSKATLIGFMAGAAIIVSLQQLKALLGITYFTPQMGLVPVLSSVFHHTNEWSWQAILGAIIVTAVVGLIDIPAAYHVWKIDKFDFLVLLCAFLGVIFISVQGGLAIAVSISIFKILMQITRPKTVMLGNIPGTDIYRNILQYKEAARIPGFLILSIEAPINFAISSFSRVTRGAHGFGFKNSTCFWFGDFDLRWGQPILILFLSFFMGRMYASV